VSAEEPTRPPPRWLADGQGMPGDWLVGFTQQLMGRHQQLLGDGQPPQAARDQAVGEAIQAFDADAGERGWTVTQRRISQLADDTLGVEQEYRDRHGFEPDLARLFAIGEVLEAEQLRGEIPQPWWRDDPPSQRPEPDRQQPQPPERPPDGHPTVRTQELGDER
jgi:hypothetical protein